MIELIVKGTGIYGKLGSKITSGTVGRRVKFIFDDPWDTLLKTAVFTCNEVTKTCYLEEDECVLPWEVVAHENVGHCVSIGVCGLRGEEVVFPTIYTNIGELLKGATTEYTPSTPHTPDLAEQMIVIAEEALRVANSVREDADNGKFDGTDVDGSLVANAIKGTAHGNFLFLTDVSPIEHEIGVKVRRKNYFDIDALTPLYGATIDVDNNKLTVTTSYAEYPGCRCQVRDKNMYGKSVTISFSYQVLKRWSFEETYKTCRPTMELAVYNKYGDRLVYKVLRGTMVATESLSLTVDLPAYEDGMYMTISFHVSNSIDGSSDRAGKQVVFSDIQLEEGPDATAWAPYIKDLTKVQVNKSRNGSIIEQYWVSADGSVDGVTSVYPYTTLSIDRGAVMDCTYNRDLNKVYEEFYRALIAIAKALNIPLEGIH